MEVGDLFKKERNKKNQYTLIKKLGKGAFGTTYLAEKTDGKQYILKEVGLDIIETHDMYKELEILKKLSQNGCENGILCYSEYFFDFETCKIYIVTEAFENSIELIEFIESFDINIEDIIQIFKNICKSLKIIHDKGIAHKDLKGENILINPFTLETMIIDFGLSCDETKCKWGGTYQYMAPEMLLTKQNRTKIRLDIVKKSDIFSLGIIFWSIINKKMMYDNHIDLNDRTNIVDNLLKFWENKGGNVRFNYDIIQAYNNGDDEIKNIYHELEKLVTKMLNYDWNKRIDINGVLEDLDQLDYMIYIKNIDKDYN